MLKDGVSNAIALLGLVRGVRVCVRACVLVCGAESWFFSALGRCVFMPPLGRTTRC